MPRNLKTSRLPALVLAAVGLAPTASAAPPESANLRRTVTVEVVERTENAIVNIATTTNRQIQRRMGFDIFGDHRNAADPVEIAAAHRLLAGMHVERSDELDVLAVERRHRHIAHQLGAVR